MITRTIIIGVIAIIFGIIIGQYIAFDMSGNDVVDTDVMPDMSSTMDASMQDVTIGHIAPITGDVSHYGTSGVPAVNLAVADFNEYLLTINADWKLQIIHEDSQSNPETALNKLTALDDRGINIIIGPYSSSNVRASMDYAGSNDMVLISPASTAPQLALPNDTIFRTVSDDSYQAFAISTLVKNSGIDNLVVIQRGDTWGDGLYLNTATIFEQVGGTIDEPIRYNPDIVEFEISTSVLADSVMSHIENVGAENVGVLTIGFSETLALIQSASNHDILDDVSWFCTDGIASNQQIINDPIAVKFFQNTNMRCTQADAPQNAIRNHVELKVGNEIGETVNTYAYSAYDAVWIAGKAILETRSSDTASIVSALPNVAMRHNGAFGHIMLNNAGDLDSANYAIWEIDGNNQWKVIAKYSSVTDTIFSVD